LLLPADSPLADIEQAIMRECAFHQARTEISRAEEPESWLEDLLSGRDDLLEGAVSRAERQGYTPSRQHAVAFVKFTRGSDSETLANFSDTLREGTAARGDRPVAARYAEGLAVLLPPDGEGVLLKALKSTGGLSCGIGAALPLLQATESLEQATLAANASSLVYGGAPTYFAHLGPLRLLLLLYEEHSQQLASFVNEAIGSLLAHDAGSGNPLIPTVRAYIAHGGRLRDTAEHLFVHRNTLAYRLERAAEILGADLKDSNVRLEVELALLALPLVDDRVMQK
jgi:purine catabolism regulator